MKAEVIIDHETQKVKLVFDWQDGKIGKHLSADEAEKVARLIEEAMQQAGREAFQQWLEQFECDADAIEVKGTKESQSWYRKMEALLLEYDDGVIRVIRSLEYYLANYEYAETRCGLIESCLTFLRNNSHRMEYKRFRDNGWPIGSGPVEGACKNIVKQRMCRSGMRWSLPGGQAILTLRTIVKSNRWPLFGEAYKQLGKLPRLTMGA